MDKEKINTPLLDIVEGLESEEREGYFKGLLYLKQEMKRNGLLENNKIPLEIKKALLNTIKKPN